MKIESGVKIPSMRSSINSKYPFTTMEVGDCFDVACDARNKVASAANGCTKRTGRVFTTRKLNPKIVRVWRTK